MRQVFLLLSSLAVVGCSSSTSVESSVGYLQPFRGLYITTERSPLPIAQWNSPNGYFGLDTGGVSGYLMDHVFPNPSSAQAELRLRIPESSDIEAWISPVPTESDAGSTVMLGVAIPVHPSTINTRLRTIVKARFEPGLYNFDVKLDDPSKPIEPGFYRIFVSMGKQLFWQDIAYCPAGAGYPCSQIPAKFR